MNPRSTSLLLAGCLFALPALLPAQGAPTTTPDTSRAAQQLRAAVERLRTEDLSAADRAQLMDTLRALHAKLDAIHADQDAKTEARRKGRADEESAKADARKAKAADEAARAYERGRAQDKGPDAAQYERALRAYDGARDKIAAAEKALNEHKAELDHADQLVKRLRDLRAAEGDAAEGRMKAAAERVRVLQAEREAQQPSAPRARLPGAAQDSEIRELIGQVRRQLAEVRRLMDEIRRRMDGGEAPRGRGMGRSAGGGAGMAPVPSRGQPTTPAPQQGSDTPTPPVPGAPRGRLRSGGGDLQPVPPAPDAPPAAAPRRRTAQASPDLAPVTLPGMPSVALPTAPELPSYGAPVSPALPPAPAPPAIGVGGGVTTPAVR